MIKPEEIRIGNAVYYEGKLIILDEDSIEVLMGARDYENYHSIKLTHDILTNNLGFTATDLNGFTQYQLEDFILIRADLGIKLGIDMPFTFVIKSSIQEMLNITEVHHLQNLFLDLKRKQLKWKI